MGTDFVISDFILKSVQSTRMHENKLGFKSLGVTGTTWGICFIKQHSPQEIIILLIKHMQT